MKYLAVFLLVVIIGIGVVVKKSSNRSLVLPSPASSPTVEAERNIIVTTPSQNDAITNPVAITGTARVFENVINYRIKDSAGVVLASGHAVAKSPDVGQFGRFEIQAPYKTPKTRYGVLEIYWYSPKDGAEIDKQVIYVKFP